MQRCDVLVVGAGPTGLTLAARLRSFGATVRVVDRLPDRVHESRALGVQPRTLEVLRGLGLSDRLVQRGNPTVRLRIHAGSREVGAPLFDIGLADTAFPFLLFVSQAETETILGEHLSASGVTVEREVEFVALDETADGVASVLRDRDGQEQQVLAKFLVGCDGGRSTVRELAGIPFTGSRYPQTFLLADLEADGLQPGAVHAFLAEHGPLLFFPLGRPATWRMITMRSGLEARDREATRSELQELCDRASPGRVRLHEPVWATAFGLEHRYAVTYQSTLGRVFVAGDAAHVHSPAGGQGMNTGIQDAWNLGWKLALACRGDAGPSLLESYDAERRPVGRFVVRFTDRAFTAATSSSRVGRLVRAHVAPRVLPVVLRFRPGRALAFRTISELGIHYRDSPAVRHAAGEPRRGPKAGDRLPDVRVVRDGQGLWLHEALTDPACHLLLCGAAGDWAQVDRDRLQAEYGDLVAVHHVDTRPGAGVLHDPERRATRRLRVDGPTQILVRPDGHIGHRCGGLDLAPTLAYLAWLFRDGQR